MVLQRAHRPQSVRGFNLLESLLVLLVAAVALGLTARLIMEYGRVARFQEGRQQWTAIRLATFRMSEELYEALSLQVGDSRVEFTKFDPSSHRERRSLERSRDSGFNPYSEEFQLRIRYELSNSELLRTVEGPARAAIVARLASGLRSLSFESDGDLLAINVSAETENKVETAQFVVELP